MLTTVTTTTTTTTMVTTMTTTTTTTTTAAAAAANAGHAVVFGALAVVVLILLLIAKELLSAYAEEAEAKRSGRAAVAAEGRGEVTCVRAKSLARSLSVAILPLLFCFILIVAVKVLEVL